MTLRVQRNLARYVSLSLFALAATGCAATYQRTKEDAAVIRYAAHVSRPSSNVWLGPVIGPVGVVVGIVHLPLSFIVDTVTFPWDARKPKKPNQAPEPTPTSVTSPAAQETRQP